MLPAKVLMIIFRAKLLDALRIAERRGKLQLPTGMRSAQLRSLLNKLGRQLWNVRILERFNQGCGVLTYLARYLRGGPISNTRILKVSSQHVTFRCPDNRDLDEAGRPRAKLMTLTIGEFLNRLIQHVPPPRMQTVRSSGIYANNKQDELNQCHVLLGNKPLEKPARLTALEAIQRIPKRKLETCDQCGSTLCREMPLPSNRDPPQRVSA